MARLTLRRADFIKFGLVFASYFITGTLGLKLDAVSRFATLVWAPTGIALAAVLLLGYRLWPVIAGAAFLVNFVTGAPFLVALGIAAGNTLEALTGAYLLRRWAGFHHALNRLKDAVALMIAACILSTLVSSTAGVLSLWLGGVKSFEGILPTWRAWWVGDALGDLIVAPLILVWAALRWPSRLRWRRVVEALALSVLLVATSYVVFISPSGRAFWFFPLIVWGALRFGQIGNVTLVFTITGMAVWGTTGGTGPFAASHLRDGLFILHGFMTVLASTGMILAAALGERRHAIQARDEFLSIASHELRTPLTSLSLQIQMTKNKIRPGEGSAPSPEKLAQVFSAADKQINRLSKLVDELLDASRIQTGKFTFNFEEVNLSEVVSEMVDRFAGQLAGANCPTETQIQTGVHGFFDHARIEQVIDNLLTNAVRYAPGKPVKVGLDSDGKTARLVIEDQGPGIKSEHHAKVFERFERAGDAKNTEGLGLGLFIVREIVKGHGGVVRIERKLETGAKFVVELPESRGQPRGKITPPSSFWNMLSGL